MGRHVNHFDVQDKIQRQFRTTSSRNQNDPDNMSLAEQIRLADERKKRIRQQVPIAEKPPQVRFAGWVVVKRIKRNR